RHLCFRTASPCCASNGHPRRREADHSARARAYREQRDVERTRILLARLLLAEHVDSDLAALGAQADAMIDVTRDRAGDGCQPPLESCGGGEMKRGAGHEHAWSVEVLRPAVGRSKISARSVTRRAPGRDSWPA